MEVRFDINKQTILDSLVVLQLILLVVLGSYTMSLSKKVETLVTDGGTRVAAAAPTPTQAAPTPNAPAGKVDFTITEEDHVYGDFNAPITLVEFSDVECPFCLRHHQTMTQLVENYPGKVRWVWRHYPLTGLHPNAIHAGEAAECAGDQGKFWEFLDVLMENQRSLSKTAIKGYAQNFGLNMNSFNTCLDSEKYKDKVLAEMAEGDAIGVQGTPATFVNGELVSGAVPYDQMAAMIDSLLQ